MQGCVLTLEAGILPDTDRISPWMAHRYSDRPPAQRGALVVYTSYRPGSQPTVINFQYNPGEMKRSLEKRKGGDAGGGRRESNAEESPLRASGPPIEKISMTVELDAADQLAGPETPRDEVREHGLHPALAILELLLYPPSARVRENREEAEEGRVQVNPEDLPLVVLVWGQSRAVPVTITTFSITEELFDERLNPVRAKIDLGMQVLTSVELEEDNLGFGIYESYIGDKEDLARLHPTRGSLSDSSG